MESIPKESRMEPQVAEHSLPKAKKPKVKVTCDICGQECPSRDMFRKHRSRKHRDVAKLKNGAPGAAKLCGLCNVKFSGMVELCEHLNVQHYLPAKVLHLEFETQQEFEFWVAQQALEGNFDWAKRRGKGAKASGKRYLAYICHRSGQHVSAGNGIRAPKVSIKMGFDCSTFANAIVENNGKVTAVACVDHYGHNMDTSILRRKPRGERIKNLDGSYIKRERPGLDSGPAFYRKRQMHRQHRKYMDLTDYEADPVTEGETWLVSTENEPDYAFTVRAVQLDCDCNVTCQYCNVCPDMYTCDCGEDVTSKGFHITCKHMHLISDRFNKPQCQPAVTVESMEVDASPEDELEAVRNKTTATLQHLLNLVGDSSDIEQLKMVANRSNEVRLRMLARNFMQSDQKFNANFNTRDKSCQTVATVPRSPTVIQRANRYTVPINTVVQSGKRGATVHRNLFVVPRGPRNKNKGKLMRVLKVKVHQGATE